MNAQMKKTSGLAFAISMLLISGSAWAVGNTVTFEGDVLSNNGTGNSADIAATGAGSTTVSIYQIGDGNGSDAAHSNRVGYSANSLLLNSGVADTVDAHLGQGAYWDSNTSAWVEVGPVTNNTIKGTITSGTVEVSQNTGDAAATANSVTLNVNGSGKVIVNQGDQGGSGNGIGLTASVTQTGSGTVTLNQGNSATSTVTAGQATLVHAGSGNLDVTQNDGTLANAGLVQTDTTGTGNITINHHGSNTFIDTNGDGTGTTATVNATVNLVNLGTGGKIGVKEALGTVYANKSGTGNLTIKQSGTGNTYVNQAGNNSNVGSVAIGGTVDLINSGAGDLKVTAAGNNAYANISGGNLTIHDVGTGNNIYVNNAGNSANLDPGMSGGNLTLNGDGAFNVIKVTDFRSGTVTVNQGAGMNDSSLVLTSAALLTGTVTLNQNGDYQDATVRSANNSTGTFNLNEVGTVGARTTMDLTF